MNRRLRSFLIIMMLVVLCSCSNTWAKGEDAEYLESVRAAIQEVCMTMVPFTDRPDKVRNFKLVNESEINAFADSKGDISFYMGMVDFVRTEDEIAAVCGHELTHLSAQHIKRSLGNSILATVAQVAIGGTAGDVAGALIQTKQGRKHEREADEKGVMYMWQAGYDPRVIWKFWASLDNYYKSGNLKIQKYFSTHPVTKERVENLKVHLVRVCKSNPEMNYCTDILSDQDLLSTFDLFESRD